jgi:AcrR family transcriptional regulator
VAQRPRLRQARLTESEIVAVALEIIAAVGVDGLTMRQLSDRLGVATGAAYKHVADKDAILKLASNELFGRVEAQDDVTSDWVQRLRLLMTGIYDLLRVYPGMASYLAAHEGEARLRLAATIREMLKSSGFGATEADDVMAALFFYVSGALLGPQGHLEDEHPEGALRRESFARGLDLVLDGARAQLGSRPLED